MALERLLGATALATVDTEEAIGGTAKQLGWNFATSASGKAVTRGYVRMTSAGAFVAGTKWQLWERATPIADSILRVNVELGGITGSSGDEIEVPAFTAWPIAASAAHMCTIFHPSGQSGNNWYEAGFGARTVPPNVSLSGNCIYYDTSASASTPPQFEGFTDGAFAVDVGIDDEVTTITISLGIVLPVPVLALTADEDIAATLAIVLPAPATALAMDADIAAQLGITLPVPSAALTADADISASLGIILPTPSVALSADEDITAQLGIVLPAPVMALNAGLLADISASLNIVLPVPQVALTSAGTPGRLTSSSTTSRLQASATSSRLTPGGINA